MRFFHLQREDKFHPCTLLKGTVDVQRVFIAVSVFETPANVGNANFFVV